MCRTLRFGIEIFEVVRLVQQKKRVQQPIDEHIVLMPVPQVLEEVAEVVRLVPQKRVQRMDAQSVEVFGAA